ncbi:DNA dependent DNA polymerase alpha subunit [Cryptosporidium bovis]|uniref:DNA dependent DNA polymerase alpha subunit n=1 Tax=Cryptosporidium bovis TaxID=310047 RepID=UPI00351A3E9C|nr:DNA dependent DNA polymerase alpha subunit [Cryptosporidium bovis]
MNSTQDGDVIIEKIKSLLGNDYEDYKDSFIAIHKIDPLINPHKFLSHVEKYIGNTKSKFNGKSIGGIQHNLNNINSKTDSKDNNINNNNVNIDNYSIGSYTILNDENDIFLPNNFKLANLKSIYNENKMRRKGCITDKSITRHKIVKSISSKEDALWLDSDLDSYSSEVDNRIQYLIDEIINNFSERWVDEDGNKYPITPVGEIRKQLIVNLGAIGCDNEGNMNNESVLLLGTKCSSAGNYTQLKLDNVSSDIALFPGQVVAVLGNTRMDKFNQTCLYAKEIIGGLPPKIPSTSLKEFKEIRNNYSKSSSNEYNPVQIMIFSGPYTVDNKILNFKYLDKILEHANSEKPHILLLLGPFLDSRNESIIKGDIYDFENNNFLTFEEIYNKIIFNKIDNFAKKNEKVRIYIVPSEYDINHHFPLPQPGLNETIYNNNLSENIYFLSNPCEIHVNDFKIMVTSSDIVTPITNSIITKINNKNEIPIEVTLSQFLYQRTLYPCYPVQHPINPKLWKRLILNEELPHIFISNYSNNGPFIKPVIGRVFINPTGNKQYSGVSLFLHPPDESQVAEASSNSQNDSDNVPLIIEERICADEIEITNN